MATKAKTLKDSPSALVPDHPHVGTGVVEDVADLLHRRSDLSTFLVHFTKSRENLLSILVGTTLEARNPWGMLKPRVQGDDRLSATQRCVCLTETPLEHAWMMCRVIAGREYQFAPYGLAFSKVWARRKGANPVWYVDITPGHDWLMNPLNDLADVAFLGDARVIVRDPYRQPILNNGKSQSQGVTFEQSQIAQLAPFIEQMGTGEGYRKEFWWEREWRMVGSLRFNWDDILAVFVPESDHKDFANDLAKQRQHVREVPRFLDPSWGLERMIASLRGLPLADVGPLPNAI